MNSELRFYVRLHIARVCAEQSCPCRNEVTMIDLTRLQPLIDRIIICGSDQLAPITRLIVEAEVPADSSRIALDMVSERVGAALVHGMRIIGAETGPAAEVAA